MTDAIDPRDVASALCGVPRAGVFCRPAGIAAAESPATLGDGAGALLRARLEGVLARPELASADIALSGGLDSASLAAFQVSLGRRPQAWTLDDGTTGETERAAGVASELGLSHQILRVSGEDLAERFEDAVRACGSVLWNGRAVTKAVFWKRAAAGRARQILVGTGADELLGDPLTHLPALLASREAQRSAGLDLLREESRGGVIAVSAWLGLPPEEWSSELDPRPGLLRSVLCAETLPPEVAAGRAAGLSVVLPYLEPPVASYALALPRHTRRRGGLDKWPLREAVSGLLPDETRQRPKTVRLSPPAGGSERARTRWAQLLDALLQREALQRLVCVDEVAARELFERQARRCPDEPGYATSDALLMRLASLLVLSGAGGG